MAKRIPNQEIFARLSRRERQIMDVIYAKGSATSAEVLAAVPDPPSYSAMRSLMRILVDKGLLKHHRTGLKYIFEPVVTAGRVRGSALSRLVKTLFDDSLVSAVAALLDSHERKISADELNQLKLLIAQKEAQSEQTKP